MVKSFVYKRRAGLNRRAVWLCNFIFRLLLIISFLHAFFLKKAR